MIRTPTGESCPACGSRQMRPLLTAGDRLYRTTAKQFQVVECEGCRLLRLHPWPDPAELATFYPETYWFSPSGAAGRLEETYRRIVLGDHVRFAHSALAGVPGPVLDVGCGGGLFAKLLRSLGHKAFGLDLSLQAASIAWGSNQVPAAAGLLPAAPIRRGSCGAITMFHVLEHLYDPASYLQAAHELLAPGGRLIVQVPNAACWQFLLLGESWNGLDVPRHLIDFRSRDLDALLRHCGFEPVRHKYFSLRDNPAGLATSLAPGLDPMARRIRNTAGNTASRVIKDLVYFALVVASLPLTLLEAACRQGSTVMIEARKR